MVSAGHMDQLHSENMRVSTEGWWCLDRNIRGFSNIPGVY